MRHVKTEKLLVMSLARQDEAAGRAKQVGADIRTGIEDAQDNVAKAACKVDNKIAAGVDRVKEETHK